MPYGTMCRKMVKYKKELAEYGWQVSKISMKEQTVFFHLID